MQKRKKKKNQSGDCTRVCTRYYNSLKDQSAGLDWNKFLKRSSGKDKVTAVGKFTSVYVSVGPQTLGRHGGSQPALQMQKGSSDIQQDSWEKYNLCLNYSVSFFLDLFLLRGNIDCGQCVTLNGLGYKNDSPPTPDLDLKKEVVVLDTQSNPCIFSPIVFHMVVKQAY